MEITKAIEELKKNRPKICKWENYDNLDRRRFIGVFPDHETSFGRALDAVIKAVKKDHAGYRAEPKCREEVKQNEIS